MSNIRYWSRAKKIDYCTALGQTIAGKYFELFGPKSDKKMRGPTFKYPTTLYNLVKGQSEIQAMLHDLSKYEEYVVKAAGKEIKRLVKRHKYWPTI